MSGLRSIARLYLGAILAAAVVLALVLTVGGPGLSGSETAVAVALAMLLGASYCYTLSFARHVHVQLDSGVVLATVLLLPPGPAMLVCLAGPVIARLRRRGEWSETLFNAGQTALQAAAAGSLLGLVGWRDRVDPFGGAAFLVAVPMAGVVLYLVNTLAVAMMIGLQQDRPMPGIWRQVALKVDRTEIFGHLTHLGFGVLAAIVVQQHP